MKKGKGIKSAFSNRKFKMGGFQTLTMVIVIVVVIVLNLIVGKMDITVDLSSDSVYSLTEATKKLADGMKDDITIYYLCQDGKETTQIEKVINQYGKLGHISVVKKDPVLYPNFAKEYTDEEVSDNDVIVVNEANKKSKYIKASELLIEEMDYQAYYTTGQQNVNYTLDAEGQITAALQYAMSDETKKLYMTTKHGEAELNSEFNNIMSKSDVSTESLEDLKSIPEDCDILMAYGPKYDFTDEEYKVIYNYLQQGGKAMFFMNIAAEDQPNYKKLLKDYGVNAAGGYLIDEPSAGAGLTTTIVPEKEEHDITAGVGSQTDIIMPNTVGFTSDKDVRSTLTVESLLKTGDTVFSRADMKETANKKLDSDQSGPFSVLMAVTDEYTEKTQGEGKATKILVYGSYFFIDGQLIATNRAGNRSVLVNSITWLTGKETSSLAIPTRNLNEQSVQIPDGSRVIWTAILVAILPIGLIVAGIMIWYRRRKR